MPIVTTPGQVATSVTNPTVSTPQPVVQPVQIPDPVAETPSFPAPTPVSTQSAPSTRMQSMVPKFAPTPTPLANDTGDTEDDFTLDDFDSEDDDGFSTPSAMPSNGPQNGVKQQSLSRMTEDDRRRVINDAFQLVLGKEPTDRDFSPQDGTRGRCTACVRTITGVP